MFKWIFEDRVDGIAKTRIEATERLYAAMCSLDIERFDKELLHARNSHGQLAIRYDFRDPTQRTLLHIAVMVSKLKVLQALRHTAPINARDDRGYTALHYAVMIYSNMDIIYELILQGIDADIQSEQGYTAYDIIEALWQDECNHLRKELGHTLFNKFFMEKIEELFEGEVSKEKIQKLLKEHPKITQLLKKQVVLKETLEKKLLMEKMQAQRKKTVDFSTFLEPYFLYFGLPGPDHLYLYWYDVPKEFPSSKTASLNNKPVGSSASVALNKEHEASKEANPALSKSRTESNVSSVNDNGEELKNSSSIAASTVPDMQQTLELSESLELTEESLGSLAPSRASRSQVSIKSRFFEIEEEADDEFSEYSLISSSTTTSTLCSPKVRRGTQGGTR